MAFDSANGFAVEMSIRTQLNYYALLKVETAERTDITEEEKNRIIRGIECKIHNLQDKMVGKGYRELSVCCGTQLINSVLGLLVLPQQEFFNKLTKHTSDNEWNHLPTLSRYAHSGSFYHSTYEFYDKYKNVYKSEDINTCNILKHMRNSISHKHISIEPISENGMDEVTDIIFKDKQDVIDNNGNKKKYVFELRIRKDDLEAVLIEISNYFINYDEIHQR